MIPLLRWASLAVFASSLFASTTMALDFNVLSYDCSTFDFSVEVTSAEWNAASQATFYVRDANNPNVYAKSSVLVSQNVPNGIQYPGVTYSRSVTPGVTASLSQASSWIIGLALNDDSGAAFETKSYPYANKCLPTIQSTSTTLATSSTQSPTPNPTTPIPNPEPTQKPKPASKLPAIVGGIVGAIALLAAVALLLFMRNRKAARNAQAHQQYNGGNFSRDAGGSAEKGFAEGAPINSVNQLPQHGSNGVMSDYIEKESTADRASSVPTFASPPISPRQSTWYAGGVPPMSPPLMSQQPSSQGFMSPSSMSPPMSPTMSATSGSAVRASNPLFSAPSAAAPMPVPSAGPARSNNPLVNFDMGNWSASPNVGSSPAAAASQDLPQPQAAQSSTLPEPMSRQ